MCAVAELGDGLTLDQFHHEVRPASGRRAGIEHAGDAGVIHHGQGLALGLEARDDLPRIHAEFDDLERDGAGHGLTLLGKVHAAEAALANQAQQLVAPDH